MFEYRSVLKSRIFSILLILCLSTTGCATLAVEQFIQHPSSEFFDVFKPTDKEWSGVYSGLEVINNHGYVRIVAVPPPDDCKERPLLNLLLPAEKNTDGKVMLRLGGSIKQLPTEDKYIGQSVRLIFYQSLNESDMKVDVKKDIALIQQNSSWLGYPSVVVVRFINLYPGAITYQTGPQADAFSVRNFDCAGDCYTQWYCKNRENNVAGVILTPFAIAFDVVTFPIQILFFAFNYGK